METIHMPTISCDRSIVRGNNSIVENRANFCHKHLKRNPISFLLVCAYSGRTPTTSWIVRNLVEHHNIYIIWFLPFMATVQNSFGDKNNNHLFDRSNGTIFHSSIHSLIHQSIHTFILLERSDPSFHIHPFIQNDRSIRSDPIRSDPIRSDPIRSDPIRSDPIWSDPIRVTDVQRSEERL